MQVYEVFLEEIKSRLLRLFETYSGSMRIYLIVCQNKYHCMTKGQWLLSAHSLSSRS